MKERALRYLGWINAGSQLYTAIGCKATRTFYAAAAAAAAAAAKAESISFKIVLKSPGHSLQTQRCS